MVLPLDAGLTLELASGVVLVVVAALLFYVRYRRVYTLVFALFLVVWGGVALAGAVGGVLLEAGLPGAARAAFIAQTALAVDAYLPLVYFASVYPVRHGLARHWSGGLLVAAPAVLGNAALLVAPGLLRAELGPAVVPGVPGAQGLPPGALGPVFEMLLGVAFAYALIVLYRYHRRAGPALERRRARVLMSALALFVGFLAVASAVAHLLPALAALVRALPATPTVAPSVPAVGPGVAVAAVGAVVQLAVVAWVAAGLVRRLDDAWVPLLALLVGLGVGAASLQPAVSAPGGVGSLWRAVTAAALGYAVLRFEVFDLEARVAQGVLTAGVFAGALGFAVVVFWGTGQLVPEASGVAAQAVLFAVLVVALVSARRPGGLLSAAYEALAAPRRLASRRLEIYEAALAQAVASGRLDERRAFLRDLRRRLGISRAEHDLVSQLVDRPAAAEGPRQPAPERLTPGTALAGRYRVEEALGEGAAGRTYRATDRTTGRRVAVKVLKVQGADEEAVRDLLREARLAAEADHPRIVRVLDLGVVGDRPFLVAEHVPGGTLREALDRRGRFRPVEAVLIALDVLDGLVHLHDLGVVHRDLKPANVLLDADGRARIGDLGIAVRPDPERTSRGLGEVAPAGSPAYMSPQALAGEPPDPAMDVYSVGAILYEMLAGRPYLDLRGHTLGEMRDRVATEAPEALPDDVHREVARVVMEALAKDPDDRPASAAAMRDLLAATL